MMKVILKQIDNNLILSKLEAEVEGDTPFLIQYADFNVMNYFFESNYNSNELDNLFLYPDSTAVYFYIKYFLKRNFKINISTDLQDSLLEDINNNHNRIFLFGDSNAILQSAEENILLKHPSINIVGSCNGYDFSNKKLIDEINNSKIDVLFIGLGVGRQEKWIIENYDKLNVKVVMSVGGWFQYLAKNKKRAPLFLRKIHLEWLHKLAVEFSRVWKRYLIGIPKFYYRAITKKIIINIDWQ